MGCEQALGHELWAHMLTIKLIVFQNTVEKIKFNNDITTAGTGSGSEQAQGHELWAHMLTIKLIDSSKYSWRKK
jgi:hypothetical protein